MASKTPVKQVDPTRTPTKPKTTAPIKTVPVKASTPVPETILKKRRTQNELKVAADLRKAELKTKRTATRRIIHQKAEKYVREYRSAERSLIRFRRQARSSGNFFVEPEAKVALVVRIRGIIGLHPKPKKVLQLLRLRQINNATFLKLNRATLNMLKLVEPYVTYGYPNLKTVKDIIYKRGFAKINRQRIPINDNSQIEAHLGKFGIICMEDLVHQIITVGPHFREANQFLWPFKLTTPKGGWNYVKTHFNEGGDAGNREGQINKLMRRMI